jgi:tetratricopeptide (TPR) repeat protein
MNFQGFCPQCGVVIPQARFSTGYAICECGWHDTTIEKKAFFRIEKKVIRSMIIASLLMVGAYAHLINWGTYALSEPVLKVEQLTGMLSNDGYKELAQMCVDLNKFDAAKDTYLDLYRSKGDLSGLAALAHLNVRLGDSTSALATYTTYFKVGGNDGASALEFAKLLDVAGQTEPALQYYEFSIKARPELLPIAATSAIVHIMMKQGHYEEARQRILGFQDSAGNAQGYMNTELSQLDGYLGKAQAKGVEKKHHKKSPKVAAL